MLNKLLKTKNGKVVLTTFALALIIALFFLRGSRIQKPTQTLLPPPDPKIVSEYSEKLPLTIDLSGNTPRFPEKLPGVVLKQAPLTETIAKQIAEKLGHAYEPETFTGKIKGKTLIWRNSDSHLFISLDSGLIQFSKNGDITKQPQLLSDQEFLEETNKFIENNLKDLLSKYRPTNISYLNIPKGEGSIKVVQKENANIYRVKLNPVSSQLEFLSIHPGLQASFIDYLPSGDIYRLEISNISIATNTENQYSIKTIEDVEKTIEKAKLIYFDSATEEILESPSLENIRSITVKSIKLAYLIDSPAADFYKPIFILEGPADITRFPKDTVAHLYMPAFK